MKQFSLFVVVLMIAACTKEGIDGDATVVVSPAHHEDHIPGATIYVKFDAEELPGTNPSDFDHIVVGVPNEDHVHIEGLKWGNYFFYAVGFDSAISEVVSGGVQLKIKRKERKDEIELDVPVTE